MYFLDGTGFFSLICLLIQCILAWICTGLLVALARDPAPWLVRWRAAFAALGAALTVLSVRFVWAHWHLVRDDLLSDGEAGARAAYGLYLAGKTAFVWFLVAGVATLRERPWPTARWLPLAVMGAAFVVGVAVPTVEMVLLLQAPLVAGAFACAWRWLRPRPGESYEVGHRIVRGVFGLWAPVWVVYGIAVAIVGPLQPDSSSPWNYVLRLNSLIDLTLQVPLATGLMVLVVHRMQQAALDTLRERDRLREQVERAEKLRSLSTLVGGVAHEINNPLTAILGFADDLDDGDPAVRARAARVVVEQAERCRVIVQRMSALGRRQPFVARELLVDELVQRVVRGFEPQARAADVTLAMELAPGRHAVRVDGAAIEQVLTNLVANALQASPRGGRVVVATRIDGEQVRLCVDDTGPGVPVADRGRIFEPFWTSKQAGAGTGIGLAVAETVVQAHGSRIEVGDAPLGGARFEFALPWTEPVADAPVPTSAEAESVVLDVLIVDDEPQVRAAIRRHVVAQGWRVREAASGEEGFELLVRGEVRFDVVVCDLRMPGMSGAQLHDAVRDQAPHLLPRFLFLSGDLASVESRAFAARCQAPIVGKPFVATELLGRLRAVARAARSA
ncbi:MAG: hybrid sensor histidine kinase/response regulator [Planctomycetes bacterium]|nr:hybrid sensor histidine kinase/response regulator [Planctomycetota bacterium]